MKTLLILLLSLVPLLAEKKELYIITESTFDKFAAQKVKLVTPKQFKLGDNSIKVMLSKPNLPSGFMVPVTLDLITFTGNNKPELIGGYPESIINIKEKGSYQVSIKVNLIYKTSCGGIQYENLLTQNISFEIK